MRLIDADTLKKALDEQMNNFEENCRDSVFDIIDNAPTVPYFTNEQCENAYDEGYEFGIKTQRPQGEWFDCIEAGTLKARHGDYVLYKVDFLLDNLTREVYIMEGARRMSERPQGEWIEEGTEIGAVGIKYTWNKCNKCGWSSSLVIPKNFCPNCGADMRGKEK